MVVDCTGDADIAAFAGAPFVKGDEGGEMLDVTMMFLMSNGTDGRFGADEFSQPPRRDR